MKRNSAFKYRSFVFVMLVMHVGVSLFAFPRSMIVEGLKGPWELSMSLGEGQSSGAVFPIAVDDENLRQALNKTFPVIGTPLQVKAKEYCPDLAWEMVVEEDSQGGPTATITIAGKGVQQEIVLLAHVPERRAVTASIGGLAIRQIHESSAETLLKKMTGEKAIGLLTLWTDSNALPQEFVVKTGDSFEVPGTSYKAEVLEYMPHYSIDRETKEVTNYSEKPVNPALKVRLSNEKNTYEQWVWSNFSSSPHMMSKFPMRVEFNDFDFGASGNRSFIVTAANSEWWLYSKKDDKVSIEKGKLNHAYAFGESEYTFTVDSILDKGTLNKKWVNRSDKLDHPALVLSVESDKGVQEAVVELNRPAHVKTAYGTLVLNYRQKAEPKQHGTP